MRAADALWGYPRKLASRLKLELVTRRQMPLAYATRRYADALRRAAHVKLDNGFPGSRLTEDGEFYLDVRGFAIYYNVRHPKLTPGDAQSLDIPVGRQSTPLEEFVLDSVLRTASMSTSAPTMGSSTRCRWPGVRAPGPSLPSLIPKSCRTSSTTFDVMGSQVRSTSCPPRSQTPWAGRGSRSEGELAASSLPETIRGQALRSQSPTLDTFAEERGLERIDLIKVDIEGREELMPRGAQNTLLELRPIVLLELIDDHLRRSGSSRAGVERLLKAPGSRSTWFPGSNDVVALRLGREYAAVLDWLSPAGGADSEV